MIHLLSRAAVLAISNDSFAIQPGRDLIENVSGIGN